MSEFTSVLSSSAFDLPPEQAVSKQCPREVLGVTCVRDNFRCLCDSIESCAVYVSKSGTGTASILTLEMDLIRNVGKPDEVMDSINLIGYVVSSFRASKDAVSADFRLSRAENARLKLITADRGY